MNTAGLRSGLSGGTGHPRPIPLSRAGDQVAAPVHRAAPTGRPAAAPAVGRRPRH
ncbi:hypothetical protein OG762_34410 [Streptomyces sp. NBC_01136]|uniref:hypothetical protein n=1 Tax=unclassified Streptomyces TaxID=2593676 RepID=UPI0032558232|nr:hypothetical protein OG762_34410 [Streptomyces sp. NBC_01136]